MKVVKLNCSACGAPISIPENLDRLCCSSCGSTLAVDRGEGYITLKVIENLVKSIQESGEKTHTAIQESAYVTKVELRKMQVSQLISAEEMKMNALQQEMRSLCRQTQQTATSLAQLNSLRLEESNILMRIRALHMDMGRLDEGWEESLPLFQNDLGYLDEIISRLSPFSADAAIAARIRELTIERERCKNYLWDLETRLVTRQLKSKGYGPLDSLTVEEMERLLDDLQVDKNFLKSGEASEVKTTILKELNDLRDGVEKIYPRKKVELESGKLESLDWQPPFPEEPERLTPLITSLEEDIEKVKHVSRSSAKTKILSKLETLLSELNDRRDQDIPAQRAKQAQAQKKAISILLPVALIIAGLCFLGAVTKSRPFQAMLSKNYTSLADSLSSSSQKKTPSSYAYTSTQSVQYEEWYVEALEVTASIAYLRAEADINSKEISPVSQREILKNEAVAGKNRDWYQASSLNSSNTGYLYKQWVMPLHGHSVNAAPIDFSKTGELYTETFSSTDSSWSTDSIEDDLGTVKVAVKDGTYQILMESKEPGYYYTINDTGELPGEFVLSGEVRCLKSTREGYFGLMVNIQDDKNYDYVLLSNEGELLVGAMRNDHPVTFYDTHRTPNPGLRIFPDVSNTLSVSVSAFDNSPTHFTYAVNGKAFFEMEYEHPQHFNPEVGVLVWTNSNEISVLNASFDNIVIRAQGS